MNKDIFVEDLEIDKPVSNIFLISNKSDIRLTKHGTEYITYTLSDKTGDIPARHFTNSIISNKEKEIKVGDICKIIGKTDSFNGQINIKINKIYKINKDDCILEDFKKTTAISFENPVDLIINKIREIKNNDYKNLLTAIFDDDEILRKFSTAPAAVFFHHNYKHGLIEHSIEVLKISEALAEIYPELDKDLLITGAILHDIGKIYTYDYDDLKIEMNEKGILLDHIYLTAEIIKEKSDSMDNSNLNNLLHLILSHHGDVSNGWGSTVSPILKEAIALHHADNLSSKIKKTG